MLKGTVARYAAHRKVSVCHGAEINAAPSMTTTAIASKRILVRSLSDDQLKVATLDTISIAIKATHGPTIMGDRHTSRPVQNHR